MVVFKICKTINTVLLLIYAVAVALFLIAVFEVFGAQGDAMSSIFLIILGTPWIRLADAAPEAAWPWLVALLPLVNLALMRLLCRVFRREIT